VDTSVLSPAAALLAAYLREEAGPVDAGSFGRAGARPPGPEALTPELVVLARAHGVAPLLHRSIARSCGLAVLSPRARASLTHAAHDAALMDFVQRDDLAEVLAAFEGAGLRPLVFKGAALAESDYEEPWLRPRGDTDLLVAPEAARDARRLLERLDCRRAPRPEGSLMTYQASYVRWSAAIPVTYDLHWRVADPEAFRSVLTYDELIAEAIPGPQAGHRWPSAVHALLVACVHRVAHHHDCDRLLFLCDIDRLARRLDADEWSRFVGLAGARGVRRVCQRGLHLAAAQLGTSVPAFVREALRGPGTREATALFTHPRLRRVDILRSDLRQLPSWRARVALLKEHLFPPRDYVLAKYSCRRPAMLPLLYADRLLRGTWRWFRPLAG